MIIRKIVLSALLTLATPVMSADSVGLAQDKLDRFYQAFENRSSELEDIENQLFGYQNKLKSVQSDLSIAQQELELARKKQAGAKIQLVGEASQDNERALKLTTHALKMAERGVRTHTKREERVQTNLAALLEEKTRLASQISADEARIVEQEKALEATKSREAKQAKRLLVAADRAKREARARMEAEKLQASAAAERLAAIEAERKAQAAEKLVIEQQAVVQAKQEQVDLSDLDREALAYAQKEVARLESILDVGNPGRPTFKRLTLGGNKVEAKSFEFLGQNQYRVEAKVVNGRQIFQIGKHKFRRTIPAADDGQDYVFIFDAKRPSRPRLVMYKKALLENI